jgi:hypothetical protein
VNAGLRCVVLSALLPLVSFAEPIPRVPQGGLAMWPPATGVTQCGSRGEVYAPIAGACYYPVDLDDARGTKTVFRLRNGVREDTAFEVVDGGYPTERIRLPGNRHLKLSKADAARAARELEEVKKALASRTELPGTLSIPFGPPVSPLPPGRNFGTKRIFNGEKGPHNGIDTVQTGTSAGHGGGPGRDRREPLLRWRLRDPPSRRRPFSMSFHLSHRARDREGANRGALGCHRTRERPHLHLACASTARASIRGSCCPTGASSSSIPGRVRAGGALMKWNPGGRSENLEDRRGSGGGGGFRMGGGGGKLGIGGFLLLLVLSIVFKKDFFSLVGAGGGGPVISTEPGGARLCSPEEKVVQFVSFVLGDTRATWARPLSREARAVHRRVGRRAARQSAMGPSMPRDEGLHRPRLRDLTSARAPATSRRRT